MSMALRLKFRLAYYYENEQYPSDFCNGLVCLGAFKNETVTVQFATNAAVTDLHLGTLDYSLLEQTADTLKNQGMQVTELKQKTAVRLLRWKMPKPDRYLFRFRMTKIGNVK